MQTHKEPDIQEPGNLTLQEFPNSWYDTEKYNTNETVNNFSIAEEIDLQSIFY